MGLYQYKAYTQNGNEISGEIEADSKEAAIDMIGARGHIPESVKKKSGNVQDSSNFLVRLEQKLTPVKPKEIILFTKQFKTLFKAGVSMVQILTIMEAQTENKKLKTCLIQMSDDIKSGSSMHQAFLKQNHIFSSLYCSMIQAGESSGSLPDVLERLIYIIDHEFKVKSEIKAALRYPAIVLVMLVSAFFFLLTVIIPKFIEIFKTLKLDLPLPTRICLFMYNMLHDYWYVLLIGLVLIFIFLYQSFKTQTGRYYRDKAFMEIPLIGPLIVKSAMSRFASIFSILQSSGITVLESMDILSRTISNAAITREFKQIKESLTEGMGISRPLKQARYFTPMVVNMVAIGEESGNLDEMLQEIADHYDAEVEYSTKALSDAIAPILTIGLAAVVGFFALAIYLPMWDLTKMVK
ncbi:MAG: type II secretion system F family protein [Proteobacteria bacterium]|nr:type II secretion system F family protein [Pseudomonadota bacterium]MBU1386465.1 type II secretion system F family protein [Pseudomonadota bacterium]MBU1544576.1 type II secretion system F family protein [Pseudomonadota bacterium]MBU2431782.1 type II secretion system F family protein [Pseudomonadota bacterium]MBU2481213.1 type II secretion system F family protein [Pseudomonadota bacterium]